MNNMELVKLNNYQEKVYYKIKKMLEEHKKRVVITIDAPSGSGKTMLLCTLALELKGYSIKFLTFRRDQASEIKKMGIDAYTYVSFVMHHFNLNYKSALDLFKTFSANNILELYNLLIYSKKFVQESTNIIILDTYTIPSPRILLLLFIVSLKCNLRLIFSGNSMQLGAIAKSAIHNGSNFHVVQMFAHLITELDKNMRTREKSFEHKITSFRKDLRQYRPYGDVPFHFNLRYVLYTICREKYFTQERFDTLYIAQTHKQLTNRLLRFICYLDENKIPYVKAPFQYQVINDLKLIPIHRKDEGKFVPYLLLVEGYRYMYVSPKGEHDIVILEKILYVPNTSDVGSLIIVFVTNQSRLEIFPCELNYYQVLPAYRKWLVKNVTSNEKLWQFPLRPFLLTYHAVLGRTIENEHVELNTKCSFANSLYVGLCSVQHYKNIYKIHDEHNLPSYVITQYMEKQKNDYKYYYRCPDTDINNNLILQSANIDGPNEYIDSIVWHDVDTISTFEDKQMFYMRIERKVYEESKTKEMDSPLMQIAKFAQEKPDIIVNAIKAAPVNAFVEKKCNHKKNSGKKKKQQKLVDAFAEEPKSNAYVELKRAFEEWIAVREE